MNAWIPWRHWDWIKSFFFFFIMPFGVNSKTCRYILSRKTLPFLPLPLSILVSKRAEVFFFFPTPSSFLILQHQLDVLRLYSMLTLPTWRRIWSHSLKAQTPRLPPLQIPVSSPGCHPCFWLSGCKSKVPMTPSLGLIVCKNSSQNSGKQFTYNLVRLPVYYKEVFSKAARWKRCTVHSMWAGLRAPLPSPGTFTSLPTRKLAKSPSLDLYRGFIILGFPGGLDGKESASSAGEPGSVTGLGRSPGGGHGNPL